ncbi:antiterminator LoaP [Clostridium sporogenes]|uniref:antiterminator LoaP n=1 Tax=Clostridium sporogenes TaxID=1509 RepID=UPI002237C00F|nr:antiterminator LoaP [Clostridium sporogenes]MCW6109115.1 antiterminator LoaP [Clostridium sporogenes]
MISDDVISKQCCSTKLGVNGRSYVLEVCSIGNWYVFFVQTGKEYIVCEFLNKVLDNEQIFSFVPKVEKVIKNSRQVRKEIIPLFPGYVITDAAIDGVSFIEKTIDVIRNSKYIIKLLGKENLQYMHLSKEEKDFLLEFCNSDYIVEESTGFVIGDKVIINSGPLKGRESVIKKIDRHKRSAEIELKFLGALRHVKVGLEVFKKL